MFHVKQGQRVKKAQLIDRIGQTIDVFPVVQALTRLRIAAGLLV
jgi:hypothetical protein